MAKLKKRTKEKSARAVGISTIPAGITLLFQGNILPGAVVCLIGISLIGLSEYFRDFEIPLSDDDIVEMVKELDDDFFNS